MTRHFYLRKKSATVQKIGQEKLFTCCQEICCSTLSSNHPEQIGENISTRSKYARTEQTTGTNQEMYKTGHNKSPR